MAGLGAIRGSQGPRRGLGNLHPEVIYRANGGAVRGYAEGGSVTGTYGSGPELLFFPLNSPLPPTPQPDPTGDTPSSYGQSAYTTYNGDVAGQMANGYGGAGNADPSQEGTTEGRSLGDVMGGGNMGRIGGVLGTLGGLATGFTGAGLVGRGLGSAVDVFAANDRIGSSNDRTGANAGRLGFGDWFNDVVHGLTFGVAGKDANDAERESHARDALGRSPAQLEREIERAGGIPGPHPGYEYSGPDYGWSAGSEYQGGAESGTVGLAMGGPVGLAHAGPVRGPGGGQEDLIDARLSDGEHVFDADLVAAIGDGSNEEGHRRLESMKRNIRKQKRSAPAGKIPPKTRALGSYMTGGK